jgi:hypothetical protein
MSILTYIAGWPLLAALLLIFVPRNYRVIIRAIAVLATLHFHGAGGENVHASLFGRRMRTASSFEQQISWVESLGISYHVGVDGYQRRPHFDGRHRRLRGRALLLGNPEAREGILHPVAGHDRRHSRRVRLAGLVLLLLPARTRARADLHHDRRLGSRRKEKLRHVPDHAIFEHRRAHRAHRPHRVVSAIRGEHVRHPENHRTREDHSAHRSVRRTSSSRCCCSALASWFRSGRSIPGRRWDMAWPRLRPPCCTPAS